MARRLQGLPLEEVSLDVGGQTWRLLAVKDQSELLAISADLSEFPYGLLLWESAIGLADVLVDGAGQLSGQRVLELGAGTGLPGLVARALGAEVLQSDHGAEAVALCAANGVLNGFSGPCRQDDWTDWEDRERYDLILGSDVLYARESHEALRAVLDTATPAGGRVLLSDPGRPDSPGFIADIIEDGWHVTETRRRVPAVQPIRPHDEVEVAIYELVRPALSAGCRPG